jgi:hypothetical protein
MTKASGTSPMIMPASSKLSDRSRMIMRIIGEKDNQLIPRAKSINHIRASITQRYHGGCSLTTYIPPAILTTQAQSLTLDALRGSARTSKLILRTSRMAHGSVQSSFSSCLH